MTDFYVDGLLRLVAAPQAIREMVQAGQVSASVAIQALRAKGNKAVAYLQAALAKANGTGKTKLTAKHLPGYEFTKQIKQSAPKLYETIAGIVSDPGYLNISEELRGQIQVLLDEIQSNKEAESGISQ